MLLLKSMASHDRSIVPHARERARFLPRISKEISILLSLRIRVLITQILAYMLDSLVRVSRRVDENHFVRISTGCYLLLRPLATDTARLMLCIGALPATRSKFRDDRYKTSVCSKIKGNIAQYHVAKTLPLCKPYLSKQTDSDTQAITVSAMTSKGRQ